MIYHLIQKYQVNDSVEQRRLARAEATWRYNQEFKGKHYLATGRTSKSQLGDTRELPFVKDMIEWGITGLTGNDWLLLTNTDSCLVSDLAGFLKQGPFYSHRRNFHKPIKQWLSSQEIMARGEQFIGADLFFFPVSWWQKVKSGFPDLLIGTEGWDWIFKILMKRERGVYAKSSSDLCYHEYHGQPVWMRERFKSESQKYNRKLCYEWSLRQPESARIRAEWLLISEYEHHELRK